MSVTEGSEGALTAPALDGLCRDEHSEELAG